MATRTYAVVDKGEETPVDRCTASFARRPDRLPILVINDEGHHCWRPAPGEPVADRPDRRRQDRRLEERDCRRRRVWVEGLDRINTAGGGTPGHLRWWSIFPRRRSTSREAAIPKGQPFPWIVTDFGLVDAIESGIVKIPRLPVQDTTGRPDPKYFRLWKAISDESAARREAAGTVGKPKPDVVYREAEGALQQIWVSGRSGSSTSARRQPGEDRVPPCLIVVCDNTDIAEDFYRRISGEQVVETVTEADVQEALEDEEDEAGGARARRGKKPKTHIVYGRAKSFPELFSNTPERKVHDPHRQQVAGAGRERRSRQEEG